MNYQPNFNDPRVVAKTEKAVAWASQQLSEYKYASWCSRHIDKKIGNISHNLGRYLRSHLLTVHSEHYNMNTGKTKQYRLNVSGLCKLAQLAGIEYNPRKPRQSIGIKTAKAEWDTEIQSALFVYTHKSHRSYHPIQNIKTDIRRELFRSNGFAFKYDIENCYPTLIYQTAMKTGRIRKPLSTIKSYTDNPKLYRNKLAADIGCDYDTAKQILIAKFNGGTLKDQGKIQSLLNRIQFHKLKHNVWFIDFCNELTRAWRAIAKEQNCRSLSRSNKMKIYLQLEQSVIKAIKREFSKNNYPIFLEHDGWRSRDYIDPYLLEIAVRNRTGYSVRIMLDVL